MNTDDKTPENALETIVEEDGDFWTGNIEREVLYRPADDDDDDDDGNGNDGFQNLR